MRRARRGMAGGAGLLAVCGLLGCRGTEVPAAAAESAVAEPPAALSAQVPGTPPGGLYDWVGAIREGVAALPPLAARDLGAAKDTAVKLYVGRQEYSEIYYGQGGRLARGSVLGEAVVEAEARFHDLLQLLAGEVPPDSAQVAGAVAALDAAQARVLREAEAAGVPRTEEPASLQPERPRPSARPVHGTAKTAEVQGALEHLGAAQAAYRAGDGVGALAALDRLYLEGFEPLEARLPRALVRRVEGLIHLSLRPGVARGGAGGEQVGEAFAALEGELLQADAVLSAGSSFWFGAVNAFVILVREGLEAVLLIGALLAYLKATGAEPRHQRQVYGGMALGVLATFGTWILARTVIPIGGAHRELIEGVTALVAVAVLLYVAHWLFQKTYIHDWKDFLREHAGRAVTAGSTAAMAGLAFAAIYREGFETVLFYQTLIFDAGPTAVLAGFLPGALLIGVIGFAIIRMGVRLPLKRVFGVTNAVLLYLAFVFLGKGLNNLQEAGLFTPHPIPGAPAHGALEQLFGFYPMVETVVGQAVFVMLLALTYGYYRRALARRSAPPRAGAVAR